MMIQIDRGRPADPTARRANPPRRKAVFAAAAEAVRSWIRDLKIEPALEFGSLTVVPLTTPPAVDPGWILLQDALASGSTEISERNRAGSVPTLRVVNRGSRDVLLLDGEELVGAKQNRVLNTTILVGAASIINIPVSCVEQGRWSYRGHSFSTSGNFLYATMRRAKTVQVSQSLRHGYGYASDQQALWGDLRLRAARLGVGSPVMADAFAANEVDVRAYQLALSARAEQVGALVYGGDAWWGLDTLASATLFAEVWPRILSGYVMDAVWRRPSGRPTEDAADRLRAVQDVSIDMYAAVGRGQDCRLRSASAVGAALVADGIVGHVTAFPSEPAP